MKIFSNSIFIIIGFLYLFVIQVVKSQTNYSYNSIILGQPGINANTYYQWNMNINSSITFSGNVILTFHNTVILPSTPFISYNASLPNITGTTVSNTITFAFPITQNGKSSVYFKVFDITNPPSAQKAVYTFKFKIGTYPQITNNQFSNVNYQNSTLQSCGYTFVGVTQQYNSTVNISIKTRNKITSGNSRKILLQFPTSFTNLPAKSLYNSFSGYSLTCYLLVNGVSISPSCSLTQATQITISYNTVTQIPANSAIIITVVGVNNPPTKSTPGVFQAFTSDGVYIIDAPPNDTNCIVSQTTPSSYNGIFLEINNVNSDYPQAHIQFNSSIFASVLVGDILQLTFDNTVIQLHSCQGSLTMYRNGVVVNFSSNSSTLVSPRYYISQNQDIIISSGSIVTLQFDCTISMPPSSTPTQFQLKYKRSSSYYMENSVSLIASPSSLQNTGFTADSFQMLATTNYYFGIYITQPLSKNPGVVINIPSDVGISGFSGCTRTALSNTINFGVSCSIAPGLNSNNFVINITSTLAGEISTGSILNITINGLKNPGYPSPGSINFGITTYYDYTISTSTVETSSNAAFFYAKQIAVTPTLNQTNYAVYQKSGFKIIYNNKVDLPADINFTITFPSLLTQLQNQSLRFSTTSKSVNVYGFTPANSNIWIVKIQQKITIGTTIQFQFSVRMPAYKVDLSSIQISVAKNGIVYEYAKTGMIIHVTSPQLVPYAIKPQYQLTGSVGSYLFEIETNIPHPSPFIFEITYPSQISYLSIYNNINSNCTGFCSSTIATDPPSTLLVTYTGTTVNITKFSFTITWFKNMRYIGTSSLWNFRTLTNDKSPITYGNNTVAISTPSPITGLLNLNKQYYRSNQEDVYISLTFTNNITLTDVLRLRFPSATYSLNPNKALFCNVSLCTQNASVTTQPFVIDIKNMLTQTKSLTLYISGLISNASSLYSDSSEITVELLNQNYKLVDSGKIRYNISCGQSLQIYTCRTCLNNGTCLSCYSSTDNRYFINGLCTNNCSNQTQFLQFGNGTQCQSCRANCSTCYNQIRCITCQQLPNLNATLYYRYPDQTCQLDCQTLQGYYKTSLVSNTNITIYQCLKCKDLNCLNCPQPTPLICKLCIIGRVVSLQGYCQLACSTLAFNDSGICKSCDISCQSSCVGLGNTNCNNCKTSAGYFNSSGSCLYGCPAGSVLINGQYCGCDGLCLTCQTKATYCLTCNTSTNSALFAYMGSCVAQCPNGAFVGVDGKSCSSCPFDGCQNCTSTVCSLCQSGLYLSSSNTCVSDCKTVGDRYDIDSTQTKCVLCGTGCSTCNGLSCTTCLQNYTLSKNSNNIDECVRTCTLTKTCQPPTPDKVLPMPGTISIFVWLLVVIGFKFILSKMYLPYSFVFGGSLIEFIQIFILTILVGSLSSLSQSQSSTSSRLLQILAATTDHYSLVLGLLITSILLNYVTNVLYLIIFCKYMRPLQFIQQQIDKISNGLVLSFAMLTNYRFGLLAYSKMFPKPYIPIQSSVNLTPIHYLCIVSIILQALPLTASGILLLNDYVLTDQFMIAIDIIIISVLNIGFSIYFISISKNQEYFDTDMKKYTLQDGIFNQTQENINNDKQNSKAKIKTNNIIQDEQSLNDQILFNQSKNQDDSFNDYKKFNTLGKNSVANGNSDSQNMPLPLKTSAVTALKVKTNKNDDDNLQIQDINDINDDSILHNDLQQHSIDFQLKRDIQESNIHKKNQKNRSKKGLLLSGQEGLKRRNKQKADDFSKVQKEKKSSNKQKLNNQSQSNIKIKKEKKLIDTLIKSTRKQDEKDAQLDNDQIVLQKLQRKPNTQARQSNIQSRNFTYNDRYGSDTNQDPLPHKKSKVIKSPQDTKSQILKQPHQISMKKVKKVGKFQSQFDDQSHIEQIDLQAIIQKKVVKKDKTSNESDEMGTGGKLKFQQQQNQNLDISPSWFNVQNQRFQFSDNESRNSDDM